MRGFDETGGLPLGRRTYDIFAGYWPNGPAENALAAIINALPKWVVSTTLQEPLSWQNSTLISGDVPGAVQALREDDGKLIQVIGSGGLVQTLIRHDLVDEYRLMIYPFVMGEGKRLFRDGRSARSGGPIRSLASWGAKGSAVSGRSFRAGRRPYGCGARGDVRTPLGVMKASKPHGSDCGSCASIDK